MCSVPRAFLPSSTSGSDVPAPTTPPSSGEEGPRGAKRRVGRSIAVAAASLVLAVLLDAEALQDTASSQPFGWRRDLAIAVMEPVLDFSQALHLTAPRRWLEDAFHRPHTRPETPPVTSTSIAPPPSRPPTTSSAPTISPPTTVATRRTPTAEAPLRLLIAGDSMTEAFGPALVDLADDTGLIRSERELRYSSGLTRPDYVDWPAVLAALIAEQDPEAIVVLLGANDAQGIQTPSGPVSFGSPGWADEYRARVAATMTLLEGSGRTVYWVGLPIMRSAEFDGRMRFITDIYRTEAAQHRGVRFIETTVLFGDAEGAYSAYLPGGDGRPVLVRREDGIHLTAAGGDRLARVVMAAMADDWHVGEGVP